ncbi:MAG: CRISPR-associated protein Cas7 [Kiritimatiellae bacterium]|nr:CRISPR-associated protein Cas7 [Kiritimatiellia bacterium]
MHHTIYIRTLKKAEHTVFCVAKGQKSYKDPQFNRYVPFSSGQQVKRSIIDSLSAVLNETPSPTTFMSDITKNGELKEGEVFSTCDPSYTDQLLGGWMKAAKGGEDRTIKRRSPLSISAMRGIHPLLAGVNIEDITFDRSDRPNSVAIVRDAKGEKLDVEEVYKFMEDKSRNLTRKWIPDNKRATGLFVQDIAIDLRRLFCVSLNPYEPEITTDTEQKLRENGWKEVNTVFGPNLLAPDEMRSKITPALAHAILNWTITSNQARTFSLMETLAVAVSYNANKIAGSIRAKLKEEEDNKAEPVIEEDMEGVESFVTLSAGGYVRTKKEAVDALEKAEKCLIDKINAFDFKNQTKSMA